MTDLSQVSGLPTRRQFLGTAAAALAASALAACGASVAGPTSSVQGPSQVTIPLMDVGATVAVNGVGPGGQGLAVTRESATSVIAVSRQCTHAGCTLALPAAGSSDLSCPCHGSLFSLDGTVLRGPAVTSLRSFAAVIDTANSQVDITNA